MRLSTIFWILLIIVVLLYIFKRDLLMEILGNIRDFIQGLLQR